MKLGGQVPSNCLSAGQLRHTVQCPPTAPLHCLPVPPDSSATLSPVTHDSSAPLSAGASRLLRYTVSWLVTVLLPILLASASFCRGVGWGVEGKQVGSMDEESQVRGCYNITFICTPTNQETVSSSPLMKTHEHRPQQLNKQPASAGTLGEKGRCRPSTQLLTP